MDAPRSFYKLINIACNIKFEIHKRAEYDFNVHLNVRMTDVLVAVI